LQITSFNSSEFQTISENFTMPDMPPAITADIVSLDAAHQRRYYFDLPDAHGVWQVIKASGR
jgi:hypothetical protein